MGAIPDRSRLLARLSRRNCDESEKQLDIALRLATACEARPLAAFCNATLSGLYARRGDQVKAKEIDAVATATYRDLGMQPLPLDTTADTGSYALRGS